MATEKRLIDANAFAECLERMTKTAYPNLFPGLLEAIDYVKDFPTVDAVEMVHFNALKSLVNGEWVDCKLVEEALDIDFATGLKMFDFSRTAEWNPAPLNGQKIITKFKLKKAVVHGRWKGAGMGDYCCSLCSEVVSGNEHNFCPNCGAKMDK